MPESYARSLVGSWPAEDTQRPRDVLGHSSLHLDLETSNSKARGEAFQITCTAVVELLRPVCVSGAKKKHARVVKAFNASATTQKRPKGGTHSNLRSCVYL